MENIKWQIKYTDGLTGERKTYMQIGFESQEDAQKELDVINREREKFKNMNRFLKRPDNYFKYRALLHGKNFRIKKINTKPTVC